MKLDDIHAEIAKDFSQVNESDILNEYSKLTKLFTKYQRIKSDENVRLHYLINNKRRLIFEKRDYYSGNASPDVYAQKPFNVRLKTDAAVQKYIDADQDIIDIDNRIAIQQEKVDTLVAAVWEIKNRKECIKGIQDQVKFESGF